ncbi:uncharacterized protein P174DRAFT_434738 [Aspergillus novofumigatus IBT 16806]|uniref:Uncharacterized protein n=1 Tax=Aspergillus novofumigatus (strain IBT 16806) TaxID=1392255 RepID=A0A2I1BYB3_ASPN1|nr:uncharacterized protein P174DRAFT_434738 [Aspergillus novofumigatus IBT 16806]PKX90354.1 hypothetical protein P174DRAFT_434738 [Aspergillus novofumigatus IBT 16806]
MSYSPALLPSLLGSLGARVWSHGTPTTYLSTELYTYQQSITSIGKHQNRDTDVPRLLDIPAMKMTKVPLYTMSTRYGAIGARIDGLRYLGLPSETSLTVYPQLIDSIEGYLEIDKPLPGLWGHGYFLMTALVELW